MMGRYVLSTVLILHSNLHFGVNFTFQPTAFQNLLSFFWVESGGWICFNSSIHLAGL